MTLNFEAGYMHAAFPHAITPTVLVARAGSIYALRRSRPKRSLGGKNCNELCKACPGQEPSSASISRCIRKHTFAAWTENEQYSGRRSSQFVTQLAGMQMSDARWRSVLYYCVLPESRSRTTSSVRCERSAAKVLPSGDQ